MYARVEISVPGRSALSVPSDAVTRLEEQDFVFVQTGSVGGKLRFERWPVAVDRGKPGQFWPVLHGLEPGAMVVTSGVEALSKLM
jgi:hypothetical protein